MIKLLEVRMDENGSISISSDYDASRVEEQFEDLTRSMMRCLIEAFWRDRRFNISTVIRLLSMTEIAACAEPYSQTEELWTTLMQFFIPESESFCNSLKEQYGFNPKTITRPFSYIDPQFKTMIMEKKGISWPLKES